MLNPLIALVIAAIPGWNFVNLDAEKGLAVYTRTVKVEGPHRWADVMFQSKDQTIVATDQFDCTRGVWREVDSKSLEGRTEWEPVAPRTRAARLADFVCKD